MERTPKPQIDTNFDGLHLKLSRDSKKVTIMIGKVQLWTGSITAWCYALANPAKE